MNEHPILNGDAQVACDRYNAIRHRLVDAVFPSKPTLIENLSTLRESIDVFVLDGYGVLNIGPDAIAGAVERVASLKASGALVFVLTNGASLADKPNRNRYRSMGFDFAQDEVVSSRQALAHYLDDAALFRRWGIMAPEYSAVDELFKSELPPAPVRLLDERSTYDSVHGFILLSTADWNDNRQQMLLASLRRLPRPVLVGNPDLVAPFADKFSLEPGWYAHELADLKACYPHFFGKPFAPVFDLVWQRIKKRVGKIAPNRVAMVGDTLHTDILGGAAFGWKTVLITDHGLLRGQNVEAAIQESGICPDFISSGP